MLLCLLALLGWSSPSAQEADDPGRFFHWAYAATFGTGKYRFRDGADVLVVQMPLQWRLREPDPGRPCACGIRLLFPLTVGTTDFSLDEALEEGFSRRLEQVTFLPGVELEFPRTEQWTLRTRFQLGWGTHRRDGGQDAWIYGAGVRSRYAWPQAPGRPALINGLHWSGFDPERGRRESMGRISNGIEFAIALPRWQFREQTMHLMPHVLANWYFEALDVNTLVEDSSGEHREWEIGLAAGREEPFSIFGFAIDRLGLAFRYSDRSRGVRLVFGSIF